MMKNKIHFTPPPDEMFAHDAPLGTATNASKFFKAFGYAFNGIKFFFLHERNAFVHAVAAMAAIVLGFQFHIAEGEWLAIIFCIALVISFEMMNSGIEKLCDVAQPAYHPLIKIIKDLCAAAVLWVSLASIAVAAFIFLPKIF